MGARVEGKSVPKITEFGLILINSCIALIGSKLILPNPVALTIPPFSTSYFKNSKPSLESTK